MDELVAQVAARTGIDAATARAAVTIILKFLVNAGPPDKVNQLIDGLPGARAAVTDGVPGPSDVMGAFNALTSAGLGMGDIQGVASAFGAVAREHAGAATVDQVVAGIPGLSQFL
jgi:hypothetical protein